MSPTRWSGRRGSWWSAIWPVSRWPTSSASGSFTACRWTSRSGCSSPARTRRCWPPPSSRACGARRAPGCWICAPAPAASVWRWRKMFPPAMWCWGRSTRARCASAARTSAAPAFPVRRCPCSSTRWKKRPSVWGSSTASCPTHPTSPTGTSPGWIPRCGITSRIWP